jgi:hypothetical protein
MPGRIGAPDALGDDGPVTDLFDVLPDLSGVLTETRWFRSEGHEDDNVRASRAAGSVLRQRRP